MTGWQQIVSVIVIVSYSEKCASGLQLLRSTEIHFKHGPALFVTAFSFDFEHRFLA